MSGAAPSLQLPRFAPAHFRHGWVSDGKHYQVVQYMPGANVYVQVTDLAAGGSEALAIPAQLASLVAQSLDIAGRLS